jgi:hypothetical protein
MAEPLGLVPQRREGSGAAQILQPFDSSRIFAAYDNSNKQPKRPLLDSFGKDLNAGDGKVHPNDRWWVKEAQDKYWDAASKIVSKVKAEGRDLNTEEQRALTELKQDVADRIGVAQKQWEGWIEMDKKIRETPYAYDPEQVKEHENFMAKPITDRRLYPSINKAPTDNVTKWLQGIGNPTVEDKRKTVRADGTSVQTESVKFDEKLARDAYKTTVAPLIANTVQGRVWTDIVKSEVIAQDPNFLERPVKEQADIMADALEDYYVNIKRNQYRLSSGSVRDFQPSKSGGGAGTTKPNLNDLQPVVDRQYLVYDRKSGTRKVGAFSTDGDGKGDLTLELKEVVTFPVAGLFGSKTPQENSDRFTFIYKGKPVSGSPQQIRTYKGNTGKWSDYYLVLATPNGELDEVPLTGSNRTKLEKEFGFSLSELEEKFPDIKKEAESLPQAGPENIPDWNQMNEKQQNVYREAYKRRWGAKSATTQPATPATQPQTKPPAY